MTCFRQDKREDLEAILIRKVLEQGFESEEILWHRGTVFHQDMLRRQIETINGQMKSCQATAVLRFDLGSAIT
ncbi:hypothetical protein VD0002_g9578 [Verticillium dahliae]|uniref:Uncharacterized protein n=1 Tax=Verticillium dahliae TaxID=27337 RepID=A0AA45AQP2_VERDA|nr:hypothetical protein BJF96_g567 [Verticillium dahliae]PNH42191.1 hypothetical protein VD0003_g9841 [Verticillium dahliae]PNH57943.1 hypothetical protein VD0002_g9578 [Verticillium dahliae]